MNQEKRVVGLIAGSGDLPLQVLEHCQKNNISLVVVLMEGFARESDYQSLEHITVGFGAVGKILRFFRKYNVKEIIFAGAVRKPSFKSLKIDWKGFGLLRRLLKLKLVGDNNLLQGVVDFLEEEGFSVLEVDKFVDNLKLKKGVNGLVPLAQGYEEDVEVGRKILESISDLDIAQSIVIQQKMVMGIECIEGTAELIRRCGELSYKNGRAPVLVKMKKTHQTRKADLPTIGTATIEQLHSAGFAGIALDAENCLVIAPQKTLELANRYGIFIYGF